MSTGGEMGASGSMPRKGKKKKNEVKKKASDDATEGRKKVRGRAEGRTTS